MCKEGMCILYTVYKCDYMYTLVCSYIHNIYIYIYIYIYILYYIILYYIILYYIIIILL